MLLIVFSHEFFAVWKLWNRLDHADPDFDARRWELHKRAAAVEAIIEGTLVKLCSELRLNEYQTRTLARFRQAFQQLRQSIRNGEHLPWPGSECPEYKTFKTLAVAVAILLAGEWKRPPAPEYASEQLMEITSNKWGKNWVM